MNIWIDLTDLIAWKGNMTGIQKVVYNVASNYQADQPENIRFFYYSPDKKEFYPYDLDLEKWVANLSAPQTLNSKSSDLKQKLILLAPSIVTTKLSFKNKQKIKKMGKKALGLAQKLHKHAPSIRRKKPRLDFNPALFQKNDLILIPGNAWNNSSTAHELGLKKGAQGFKLAYIIYDLIPFVEPQFFGGMLTSTYSEYLFESISNADLLLPISHSTNNDITKFCKEYALKKPRSHVIRLGDELAASKAIRPQWVKDDKKPVLCLGTIEVRKNHMLLYYAYKDLLNQGVLPPKLIIIGKPGWYAQDVIMLIEQDPQVREYIEIRDNVTEEEVAWLYNTCLFTIYPSLYEGWGLPVAESLARGKPVLASNSSSIPEAGGISAIYFSPYNASECAQKIKELSTDPKKLIQETARVKSSFKTTTWEECYQDIKLNIDKLL